MSYLNSSIDLTSDGYDLAILNYIPAQQNLKIKNVFNVKGKLYCSKQYADKYGIPMTLEELVHHRVVGGIYNDGNAIPHYQITNIKTGEVTIIKLTKHLLINNTLHSLPLLRSNEVICPGFENINLDLEQDDIVVVLPDYYFIELKFYLVFHPHARDLKIKLFSNFLEQCLKNKI